MATTVLGSFTPSVLLAVARRTGRLAGKGLEVDEVPVSSSPSQFRALLDGGLDLVLTSPDNVLAYRFDPLNPLGVLADVRIVSTLDRGLGLGLYARPGLTEGTPLEGRTFAVDVATSGFALAMYALAERFGLRKEDLDVVALGSTPNRLKALEAGECDLTMLNAGNELLAEAVGCRRLASVADACSPYVGTVVAVHGEAHLDEAHRLAAALHATAKDICAGDTGDLAEEEAAALLHLPDDLAARYVDRLRNPEEGLILDPLVDRDGLRTVVELRRRFLARVIDGADVLEHALDDASGLVAADAPVS